MGFFKNGFLIFSIFTLVVSTLWAGDLPYKDKKKIEKKHEMKQKIYKDVDSWFDPHVDYSIFAARVTDRDSTGHVYKLWAENGNYKFFRAGDRLDIVVKTHRGGRCQGFVRRTDEGYFVVYVKDVYPCWKEDPFFRRGAQLIIKSDELEQRIHDASVYRMTLLNRREDFLQQLRNVNNFLWNFDQEKIRVAIDYDQKIQELQNAREKALGNMLVKRQDHMRLQRELLYQVSVLEKDLENYRIENAELFSDRWHEDHDLNNPVAKRPQTIKKVPENSKRY